MKKSIESIFKGKKKKIIKFCILIMTAAILAAFSYLALGMIHFSDSNDEDYMVLSDPYLISDKVEWIFSQDCYQRFETECMGNKQSVLMQYGQYYKNDSIEIMGYKKPVTLSINDKNIKLTDHEISYINVIDDHIYYRDEEDRKIYSYAIETGKITKLTDVEVGESVVSSKGISYISLEDEKLYAQKFGENRAETIIPEKVKKFTQVGNKYLCLLGDFTLVLCDADSSELIEKDVDNYLYQGNLLVQKGNHIYEYDSSHEPQELYLNESAYLLTIDQNYIYYLDQMQQGQRIFRYDGESKESMLVREIEDSTQVIKFYYAVGENEDEHLLLLLDTMIDSKKEE